MPLFVAIVTGYHWIGCSWFRKKCNLFGIHVYKLQNNHVSYGIDNGVQFVLFSFSYLKHCIGKNIETKIMYQIKYGRQCVNIGKLGKILILHCIKKLDLAAFDANVEEHWLHTKILMTCGAVHMTTLEVAAVLL